MKQPRFGGLRQLVGERLRLFRSDVEPEDLDRDEPVTRGLVCAEDRTKRANTNLVQDPKRSKRRRWCERRRVVSGQFQELLEAGSRKFNTLSSIHFSESTPLRPASKLS